MSLAQVNYFQSLLMCQHLGRFQQLFRLLFFQFAFRMLCNRIQLTLRARKRLNGHILTLTFNFKFRYRIFKIGCFLWLFLDVAVHLFDLV